MKKRHLVWLLLAMCLLVFLPQQRAEAAGPDTMVSIGLGEVGNSGLPNTYTYFTGPIGGGYEYGWCASFISWVASQAGESAAIPSTASPINMHRLVLGAGGRELAASEVRAGDLVFYYSIASGECLHVGLMTSESTTVDGNMHNTVAVSSPAAYRLSDALSVAAGTVRIVYVRPAYSVGNTFFDFSGVPMKENDMRGLQTLFFTATGNAAGQPITLYIDQAQATVFTGTSVQIDSSAYEAGTHTVTAVCAGMSVSRTYVFSQEGLLDLDTPAEGKTVTENTIVISGWVNKLEASDIAVVIFLDDQPIRSLRASDLYTRADIGFQGAFRFEQDITDLTLGTHTLRLETDSGIRRASMTRTFEKREKIMEGLLDFTQDAQEVNYMRGVQTVTLRSVGEAMGQAVTLSLDGQVLAVLNDQGNGTYSYVLQTDQYVQHASHVLRAAIAGTDIAVERTYYFTQDLLLALDSPAEGQTVDGTTTLAGWADPFEAEEMTIVFSVDGTPVRTLTGDDLMWRSDLGFKGAFSVTQDFSGLSDGTHTLTMQSISEIRTCTLTRTIRVGDVNPYEDVTADRYYYQAVLWSLDQGISASASAFNPTRPCTRAEFVTFLWRAAGSPAPAASSGFSDVSESAYYAKAVAWAAENNITSGIGNGLFGVQRQVKREEVVTFLYRYAKSPSSAGNRSFDDVNPKAYYADAVAWATEAQITSGVGNGLFGVGRSCQRCEVVTFLYRYIEK